MSSYSKNADAIAKLTPEQYRVTQQSGTERPGTGEYLDKTQLTRRSTITYLSISSATPSSSGGGLPIIRVTEMLHQSTF
jgi:peptide methionine sulfoxide reductase MsrB